MGHLKGLVMCELLGRIRLDKRGGTSVEYALIAVLISVTVIPAFLTTGKSEREIFQSVNQDRAKTTEPGEPPGVPVTGRPGAWIAKSTSSR